jgi:hypothetical protein
VPSGPNVEIGSESEPLRAPREFTRRMLADANGMDIEKVSSVNTGAIRIELQESWK